MLREFEFHFDSFTEHINAFWWYNKCFYSLVMMLFLFIFLFALFALFTLSVAFRSTFHFHCFSFHFLTFTPFSFISILFLCVFFSFLVRFIVTEQPYVYIAIWCKFSFHFVVTSSCLFRVVSNHRFSYQKQWCCWFLEVSCFVISFGVFLCVFFSSLRPGL